MSAAVAQLVERVLGKDEVMGSSPISSSSLVCEALFWFFGLKATQDTGVESNGQRAICADEAAL